MLVAGLAVYVVVASGTVSLCLVAALSDSDAETAAKEQFMADWGAPSMSVREFEELMEHDEDRIVARRVWQPSMN